MDTHTPTSRRSDNRAGLRQLPRLEDPCWVLEGIPTLHFGSREEADAECVMLSAELGRCISASQRLHRRCITVTCGCGSYLLGEDDTEASTHFRSKAAVAAYTRRRGLLLNNGTLSCAAVHETSTPTPDLDLHIGRDWSGSAMEAGCPCPKAACGLIRAADALDTCPEHASSAGKRILQLHAAQACADLTHPAPTVTRSRHHRDRKGHLL